MNLCLGNREEYVLFDLIHISDMLEKITSGKHHDEVEDKYRPSAPISTGTIPRRCSKLPPEEFGGLYNVQPLPSAPPSDRMHQVIGYEETTFDAATIPPPVTPPTHWEEIENFQRAKNAAVQSFVTEKTAREALFAYAGKRLCFGTSAAQDMAITSLQYTEVFHYELQSYVEKRLISWNFVPYAGGELDAPESGAAPRPWDIQVPVTKNFEDEVKYVKVPHTESVKSCHKCKGTGLCMCATCSGHGWRNCSTCTMYGWDKTRTCMTCVASHHGPGRTNCPDCKTTGKVKCGACDGQTQLLYYIELTVNRKVITKSHYVNNVMLPEVFLHRVNGHIQYQEEGPQVMLIKNSPSRDIMEVSKRLILEQIFNDPVNKTLAQRQQVCAIPVTSVSYNWKRNNGTFYVCGIENKVYAPDYPQNCCCGCEIL